MFILFGLYFFRLFSNFASEGDFNQLAYAAAALALTATMSSWS